MNISTPNNNLIISCNNINITFLNFELRFCFENRSINTLTNSSCSLTRRNFRALPRSDLARDGVDIGVRPLGQILLWAGDVVNVIGENAIPKEVFSLNKKWIELKQTSIFIWCSTRCKRHLKNWTWCWTSNQFIFL